MNDLEARFDALDSRITKWMARYGIRLLRISLGINFFWFGVLKFFPGMSPAQDMAIRTIETLTFGFVPETAIILLLATWESLIGLGLIFGKYLRIILLLLFVQMAGTITPIFLFPNEVFSHIPYALTLEGQYIVKNLVLISGGIVIGATVKGGRLLSDPPRD